MLQWHNCVRLRLLLLCCSQAIAQSQKLPWQMLMAVKQKLPTADEDTADKLMKDYAAWVQSAAVAGQWHIDVLLVVSRLRMLHYVVTVVVLRSASADGACRCRPAGALLSLVESIMTMTKQDALHGV